MKKTVLSCACALLLAGCCSSGDKALIGSWTQPVPGMENQSQGIRFESEGKASSIGMATLLYESWKKEDDELILTGKSIGNGQTISFTDTLRIKELTGSSLILEQNGFELKYSKEE